MYKLIKMKKSYRPRVRGNSDSKKKVTEGKDKINKKFYPCKSVFVQI